MFVCLKYFLPDISLEEHHILLVYFRFPLIYLACFVFSFVFILHKKCLILKKNIIYLDELTGYLIGIITEI